MTAATQLRALQKAYAPPPSIRRKLSLRSPKGKVSKHTVVVEHESDPKINLLEAIGPVPDGLVHFARILVAIYVPPMVHKTSGGIILTEGIQEEDIDEYRWQGKVGLIIAMGPRAYVEDDINKFEHKCRVGDWVWFRPSDGAPLEINETACRLFDAEKDIRGVVPHPDYVW